MARMVAHLDDEEYIWLKRMMTDQDREEAPEIINNFLKPLVKEAERTSGPLRAFDPGRPLGRSAPHAGMSPIPW
ncbi:MAG: hypothetical protein H5T74_12390 [Actinobacteria bacterium]|nr:hypothetical protein [Actinomycetota bacterium]